MHERHPSLTFDCTTKVEHIQRHPDVLPELAEGGCVFIVSAFESTNDTILDYLDKGHSVADASRAIVALREHGSEVRPSWLPFTPWTTLDDLIDVIDFVVAHDLVAYVDPVQYYVDPVQYTVRLLLPEGSLLLGNAAMEPHLGQYDVEHLGWTWSHPDPMIDRLQQELVALVEARVGHGASATFGAIDALIRSRATDRIAPPSPGSVSKGAAGERAHLTEPWFCCSEPTKAQLMPLAPLG